MNQIQSLCNSFISYSMQLEQAFAMEAVEFHSMAYNVSGLPAGARMNGLHVHCNKLPTPPSCL